MQSATQTFASWLNVEALVRESPGSRSPAARSRSAGTGSASGRATTSTAP